MPRHPFDIFYRSRLWTLIWGYILLIYLTLPLMRTVLRTLRGAIGRDGLGLGLNMAIGVAALVLLVMACRLGWRALLAVAVPLSIIAAVATDLPIPEERVHFLQYGLLGVLALKTARRQNWQQLAAVAVFVILIGVGDELIQWWLPNRMGDLRDVAINTLAGILGVWIGTALYWRPREA